MLSLLLILGFAPEAENDCQRRFVLLRGERRASSDQPTVLVVVHLPVLRQRGVVGAVTQAE